jgi:hypothetical protein
MTVSLTILRRAHAVRITRKEWGAAGPALMDWAGPNSIQGERGRNVGSDRRGPYGGTVLKTSLSHDGEQELQDAPHRRAAA